MEVTLALLVQGTRVVSSVQFIVKVNTQAFVFCHHLYVQSLDVHWCDLWCLPLEVDHYPLGFTAVNKVPHIPLCDTSNNGSQYLLENMTCKFFVTT